MMSHVAWGLTGASARGLPRSTPRSRAGLSAALACFAWVVAPQGVASAGNGTHIRTPVNWAGAPCMTVIDRSVDPVYALSYAVPFEDTQLTPDEVEDSRRHQFFALCRDRRDEQYLPNWITSADLDAAVANALGDPASVDPSVDVLETSAEWAGCWARITADDERRPITFEAASEPVQWDTSGLEAGTWVVEGYTWEPWTNLWTHRPGAFKIVDDPDPAASAPAVAFDFSEQPVYVGEVAGITGCVDAMAGSTMRLEWSPDVIGLEPEWSLVEEGIAVNGSSFTYDWTAPTEAAGGPVIFRATVDDPMGRSWAGYSHAALSVLSAPDPGCGDEGGFIHDDCEDEAGAGEGGGGCAVDAPEFGRTTWGGLGWLLFAALAGLAINRRGPWG